LYINNFSQNGVGVDLAWQLSEGASLLCPSAPEAHFAVSSAFVLVGEPVNFVDQSTNDPVAWEWTFTGGTPSSSADQDPIGIVYDVPGCYDVALTAYNPGGAGSTEQLCSVEVEVNTGLTEVSGPISVLQELDAITIRNADPGTMHALIFDAMGRQVLSDQGNGVLRLATSNFIAGPYIVVIRNATERWSQRVFIPN
jgi:PKD repeat protein